jgi:hypothetical protein
VKKWPKHFWLPTSAIFHKLPKVNTRPMGEYFPNLEPSNLSYIAGAVKIYDSTSSLVRFENKMFFLCVLRIKRSALLQRWH